MTHWVVVVGLLIVLPSNVIVAGIVLEGCWMVGLMAAAYKCWDRIVAMGRRWIMVRV